MDEEAIVSNTEIKHLSTWMIVTDSDRLKEII
jgi:hypothetical protein